MSYKFSSKKYTILLFIGLVVCGSSQNVFSQWNAMGSGFNGPVRAVAVVGSTLYAAGKFTMSGSTAVNNIAQWDGSAWKPLGAGSANGVNDSVNTLLAFNGELYVGGGFAHAGGGSGPAFLAKWNGSTWSSVGTLDNTVICLFNFNGSLIASGYFNAPYKNIAKYVSGTSWTSVSTFNPGGAAIAMTVHKGELYIGGYWGDPSVQYLDDTTNKWVNLPSGLVGEVRALASFKKQTQLQLYIGGDVATSSVFKLCTYDPVYGYTVPFQPFKNTSGDVNCLHLTVSNIYAGGGFTVSPFSTDINNLASYNGGSSTPWVTFGNDPDNFNKEILSLCNYNGRLIAGGRFTTFGSTTVNYISRSGLVSGIEEQGENIVTNIVYPNPMQDQSKLEIETKTMLNKPVLKIYDLLGKEMNKTADENVFMMDANRVEFIIDGSHLSPGIYYYSVFDEGAIIAGGKIVRNW